MIRRIQRYGIYYICWLFSLFVVSVGYHMWLMWPG